LGFKSITDVTHDAQKTVFYVDETNAVFTLKAHERWAAGER